MKKILLSIALFSFLIGNAKAQGPTISLVGASPSLSKGNINTEVLTAIIQQKQEEVKQKVFRNTIVKGFNNSTYTDALKNFTTYHYMYKVMDVLTSGKNKTVMTRSLTESSVEFAFVYGLVYYLNETADFSNEAKFLDDFSVNNHIIDNAKVIYDDGRVKTSSRVKQFNLTVDLCYDIILNTDSLQRLFLFKESLKDNEFRVWYENDNCYKKAIIAYDSIKHSSKSKEEYIEVLLYTGILEKDSLDAIKGKDLELAYIDRRMNKLQIRRTQIEEKLNSLIKLVNEGLLVMSEFNNLVSSLPASSSIRLKAQKIVNEFSELTGKEITESLSKYMHEFDTFLKPEQKLRIQGILNLIHDDYDRYKELVSFYSGLRKSRFEDFTLTKNQYLAMKYVLNDFLVLAKNQFDNNVVSTVIEYMLDNTLIEYYNEKDDKLVLEKDVENKDKGYLYIDIESLLSSINQRFSTITRKGLGLYIRPFFGIGTNYAKFSNSNDLSVNSLGLPAPLSNMYFASEKIGVEWRIWDFKYANSIGAGQNFKYYSRNSSRVWLRPQRKTAVDDIHFAVYASGILYNIANLKSDEDFNYGIIGAGLGLRFFNGLSTNVSLACPFTNKSFESQNLFINFSFDVPIFDYIAALRKE